MKLFSICAEVCAVSRHVRLLDSGIQELARQLVEGRFDHWLDEAPVNLYALSDDDVLGFICVLNSISFCYWDKPRWTYAKRGRSFNGTWALIQIMWDLIHHEIPVLDPEFLRKIELKSFVEQTTLNRPLPHARKRHQILRELGAKVCSDFGANWQRLFRWLNEQENGADEIPRILPSFRDVRTFDGREIHFNKRAQLLMADVAHLSGVRGLKLDQLESQSSFLTACADYKLPQVLRYYSAIEFDPVLASRIQTEQEIEENSFEEVEIRASTIVAVQRIADECKLLGKCVTANQVNDALWLLSQQSDGTWPKYHRTVTTAY